MIIGIVPPQADLDNCSCLLPTNPALCYLSTSFCFCCKYNFCLNYKPFFILSTVINGFWFFIFKKLLCF